MVILGKLIFDVDLIGIDGGVEAIIKNLACKIVYETYEYDVEISYVERTFMKELSDSIPDDINPVDVKRASINLGKVLREELLMQIL